MSADRDTVRLHARRPILGAPISEHETPRANADFESRAYREPAWREWLGIAIAVAIVAALVLLPMECHVRGLC